MQFLLLFDIKLKIHQRILYMLFEEKRENRTYTNKEHSKIKVIYYILEL